MSDVIIKKVVAEMRTLPEHLQEEVLQFLEGLKQTRPIGVPGSSWKKFAGTLTNEEAEEMLRVIEEGCGQINEEDVNFEPENSS